MLKMRAVHEATAFGADQSICGQNLGAGGASDKVGVGCGHFSGTLYADRLMAALVKYPELQTDPESNETSPSALA